MTIVSNAAPQHSDAHVFSYYAATLNRQLGFASLEGDFQADICVIGGGFTGLNTAIELAERGFSVILLEARRIGWGASGRNGGQLIRGIGHDVKRFLPLLGAEGVNELKRMGLAAVDIVRQRIQQHAIDCDLTWGFCDLANKPRHLDALAEDHAELTRQGYSHPLRLLSRAELGEVINSGRYLGGLLDMGSGHLHPLNLALGEAAAANSLGVQVFERSPVTRIGYGAKPVVHTARGRVTANTLVLACNAHLGRLQPQLSGKVLPAGSYMIATERMPKSFCHELLPMNAAVCDQKMPLDYFRLSADGRLLFGGACHYSGRDPKDIGAYMLPKMLNVFPQLLGIHLEYAWGGMIGIGANRLPQIGRLPEQPNIYYAQAYAGHGLNVTHLAGRLLAEAIAGQQGGGFDLFARVPHPTFPGGPHLRSPLLALGMLWYRLKDLL
ncbi:NAD(P)/FAD-dependent oxidoreductase [Azomonas macrocytogenes]|uniref:Glycine/D-amino acid oxidase-like deaminating enzyme n=1 Tax=Azomonas macrocytogenes TaxID=69962 RepID=A0A839T436_AZOMA|nr:FAD-binding oxidoreductase [Azomonas macrocytogenes]MBB3103094.1 glycine/D-amino acid oxidase-like deaminating enzyme [Azomonas macrocytogenes]